MADFDISAAIKDELGRYTDTVREGILQAADTCSKGLKKDLTTTSPRRRGKYAGTWKIKKSLDRVAGTVEHTVYNSDHYQRTHLLEHGHRKRGGSGSVRAIPHIAPAEQKWVQEFQNQVEEVLKA